MLKIFKDLTATNVHYFFNSRKLTNAFDSKIFLYVMYL